MIDVMDDARDARNARQLSDAAMWHIVCHPGTPAPELAEMLGVTAGRIRNARYRFRAAGGWSCRVAFVPCASCGEPVTLGGHLRRDRAYHSACRRPARQAINQRLDKRRWEAADVHARHERLQLRHDHDAHYQEATARDATYAGQRWDAGDDAFLVANADAPDYRLAAALRRSLYAVRARKATLRRCGRLPEPEHGRYAS
jgi:hypothetical protein